MILVSNLEEAIALSASPVFIAVKGSNTPHSVCFNGRVEELVDPPTLSVRATEKAQVL